MLMKLLTRSNLNLKEVAGFSTCQLSRYRELLSRDLEKKVKCSMSSMGHRNIDCFLAQKPFNSQPNYSPGCLSNFWCLVACPDVNKNKGVAETALLTVVDTHWIFHLSTVTESRKCCLLESSHRAVHRVEGVLYSLTEMW